MTKLVISDIAIKKVTLTSKQKSFNKLIKQINQKRELLVNWHSTITLYQEMHRKKLKPLLDALFEHKKKCVLLLDEAYNKYTFNKTEKQKLEQIILHLIEELLETDINKYRDLKTIYDEYSSQNYDDELANEIELMKVAMFEEFGVKIDDDIDFTSTKEVIDNLHQKIHDKVNTEEEILKELKSSKKKSAKEEKKALEKQNINQSIREIFRKLAQSLHPDREQDLIERERKNILMQRANIAYNKEDLLSLLELQLEVEHIDQNSINEIAEDKLQYYNKILKEQLMQIEEEIYAQQILLVPIEHLSRVDIDTPPEYFMYTLKSQIRDLKSDIKDIESQLSVLDDQKNIKQWLKQI